MKVSALKIEVFSATSAFVVISSLLFFLLFYLFVGRWEKVEYAFKIVAIIFNYCSENSRISINDWIKLH